VLQRPAADRCGHEPRQLGRAALRRDGQVIGLQVAIYSPTGANAGLAFAMPIAVACRQAELLCLDGGLPYLGLTPRDLTATWPRNCGCRPWEEWSCVRPCRRAGRDGRRAGGRPPDGVRGGTGRDLAAFEAALWRKRIGETARLTLERRGTSLTVDLVLGRRPTRSSEDGERLMIRHTFCHLQGIGEKTELALWQAGITDWSRRNRRRRCRG